MIDIKIKKNKAIIGEDEYDMTDIFLIIPKIGMIRADYVIQCLYDYNGIPNNFSIARKLEKYKNNHTE